MTDEEIKALGVYPIRQEIVNEYRHPVVIDNRNHIHNWRAINVGPSQGKTTMRAALELYFGTTA